MKMINASKSKVTIALSNYELRVIKNVLEETCRAVPSRSFFTRTGCTKDDFSSLTKLIDREISHSFSDKDKQSLEHSIELNNENLFTLRQGLLEVGYGLCIPDFRKKIGVEKEKIFSLFEYVSSLDKNQRSK